MKEVADVNPDTTGVEMKSTRKPRRSTPMRNCTTPVRKVSRMTKWMLRSRVNWKVTMAMSEVGPIVTSLMVPRNM